MFWFCEQTITGLMCRKPVCPCLYWDHYRLAVRGCTFGAHFVILLSVVQLGHMHLLSLANNAEHP